MKIKKSSNPGIYPLILGFLLFLNACETERCWSCRLGGTIQAICDQAEVVALEADGWDCRTRGEEALDVLFPDNDDEDW